MYKGFCLSIGFPFALWRTIGTIVTNIMTFVKYFYKTIVKGWHVINTVVHAVAFFQV
jgi:hypothetical protein